jgi:hypothetical protein
MRPFYYSSRPPVSQSESLVRIRFVIRSRK